MKVADIRQYSEDELRVRENELVEQLFAFRLQKVTGQVESPAKVRRAVELARRLRPELEIDGEMQVDPALSNEVREQKFPFSRLTDEANVLVFPNLDAANIGYKLLWRLGNAELIGPVLLNMNKPVNVVQMTSGVNEIVHLAAVTAMRAHGDGLRF